MSHKIVVADDSQTIQKVIAITLAGEPYELIECSEISNLNNSVKENKPDLILLDFNLSEDKTGYDLCKDIKNLNPDSKVVFLFGTFDTIDEDLISQSGASNWIVKPFDGNKFISLCRSLMEISAESNVSSTNLDDEQDSWVMDNTAKSEDKIKEDKNILKSSMEDWGIEVPGVIGTEENDITEIPGVIKEDFSPSSFPESEDLEYPDLDIVERPNTQLTPIEELNVTDASDVSVETTSLNEIDTNVDLLKEQIEDEQDDLWSLNDSKDDADTSSEVVKLHDTPSDFPADVTLEKEEDINFSAQESHERLEEEKIEKPSSVDLDVLVQKLTPIIEKIVREECQKITEKVSWEVIPDLAENLIQKEIQKISNETLSN